MTPLTPRTPYRFQSDKLSQNPVSLRSEERIRPRGIGMPRRVTMSPFVLCAGRSHAFIQFTIPYTRACLSCLTRVPWRDEAHLSRCGVVTAAGDKCAPAVPSSVRMDGVNLPGPGPLWGCASAVFECYNHPLAVSRIGWTL